MEKFLGDRSFAEYCTALFGQYRNNLRSIVLDSTETIFKLIKAPETLELNKSKDISTGKFYMIRYRYNDNPIWCPIFVIDDRYNTQTQKRLIYAINLDYLRYDYKITIFDKVYKSYWDVVNYNKLCNERDEGVAYEKAFKIDFQTMYKLLKGIGNSNYAITAYDYTKIKGVKEGDPNIFAVSTNLAPRFIFVDTKLVNVGKMKELSSTMKDLDKRNKLLELINDFEILLKDFNNDLDEHYKKLKLLESKYKLE